MTRPLYAPEPQGVRSASSSAFEWDDPEYIANRAKLAGQLATPRDRDLEERDARRQTREERKHRKADDHA